jgi:N-acetyl-anhydromuramyl-L-alanine amidase AmpD
MRLYWKGAKGFNSRPMGFGVDWVIFHYTAGYYPSDLSWLTRFRRGPSVHFYICPEGNVYQLVRLYDVAYHAGVTWKIPGTWQYKRWKALRPNERSIGIEISARDDRDFTEKQYQALGFILPPVLRRFNVPNETLKDPWRGCDPHERDAYEIDELKDFRGLLAHGNTHYSKSDPGLNFDWDRIKSLESMASPPAFATYVIFCGEHTLIPPEGVIYP